MRRRLVAGAIAAVLAVGCTGEQLQDISQDQARTEEPADAIEAVITNPDSVTVFRNLDRFPNIARVCIDGIAFYVTSHTDTRAAALESVPDSPECAR
jgi:aspartokinase-like uncharacterized kinase